MHTTITISDSDRDIDYTIDVDFDACPAERRTHEYPGCEAHLEINSARCTEVVTHVFSPLRHVAIHGPITDAVEQRAVGDLVLNEHHDEIEQAVLQELADDEEQGRADAAEAAQEAREERRRDEGRAA